MNVSGYLIGEYNKWNKWDRAHTIYKFQINGVEYGVKEVQMEWGLPQLPFSIEDENLDMYHIYDSKEEAIEFAHYMMRLNG